jgi:hypothetical protein
MNVDPTSDRFCEVVAWDSLSDAEKKSGKWIELPPVIKGEPAKARRRNGADILRECFGDEQRRIEGIQARINAMRPATRFDALGRPVP